MDTTGHDIKLSGKMVLLRGDVKLRLLKEYEGKYIYGNLVKTGIYNVCTGSIFSMNYKNFTQFWN